MNSYLSTSLKITAACALVAAGSAHAAFVVTVEAPGVTTAASTTFSNSGVESFEGRVSGNFTTGYSNTGITGSYTGVSVANADQYGGAGGTGKFAGAYNSTGYSLTLGGTSTVNYFGFYLSALDSGNTVTFLNSGVQVYSFSAADALATIKAMPNSSAYFGNPSTAFSGQNGTQPYAFLNFYDTTGTFDTVQFTETLSGAGYESDNHTVGTFTSIGGTPVSAVPEPETYALMLGGLGLLGFVARRRKS